MLANIVTLRTRADIEGLRDAVRHASAAAQLDERTSVDLLIVASELGRNVLVHACGGEAVVEQVASGVRIRFRDRGPGIPDLDRALRGGYSTTGTCGRGRAASKRLSDDFEVTTGDRGTTITVCKNRRRTWFPRM